LIYPGRNSTVAVVGVGWIRLRIQRRQTHALTGSRAQLNLGVVSTPEVDHAHEKEEQDGQDQCHLDSSGAALRMASAPHSRHYRQRLHDHRRASHLSAKQG